MNADRIAEVYEGSHGTPRSQELARERVHWMCRQALGEQILDIGCSQGIVSLLLGREGRSAVGIDRETAAVAEAQRRLGLEEPAVRDRVTFLEGEARALPFEDGRFDTVLLGEVLEHLIDPAVVLDEARRVLRPAGRIVVTTPYGLFPYHDHKDPLYLTELLELLTGRFGKFELELLHHYLLIVGERTARASKVSSDLLGNALAIAEQRLRGQDREVDIQRAKLKRISADLEAARASVPEHERALAALTTERDDAVAAAERFKAAEADLERREALLAEHVRERSERALRLEVERDHLVARAAAAEARVQQLGDRVDASAASAAQAARRIATLEGERDTFQQRAAEFGATLGRVQQQLETATAAAAEAQQRTARMELELERRVDEFERLEADRDRVAAERERLSTDLEETSAALDEANARLVDRDHTVEAIAAERGRLQERIAQIDADREHAQHARDEAQAAQEKAEAEAARIAVELEAARAQQQQSARRLDEVTRALEAQQASASAASEELEAVRRERDDAVAAAKALHTQQTAQAERADDLGRELAAARVAAEDASRALAERTAEAERLRKQVADRDQAVATLEAALHERDEADDERYRIQAELDIARADIEQLEQELRVVEGGAGPAVTDEAVSERTEGLERELAELRTRLQATAELEQRVVELEAELVATSANGGGTADESQLRKELAGAQEIIAAATAELDRRVDETAEQGVELDAARTEIARLTAELKVAEDVVGTLRSSGPPSERR